MRSEYIAAIILGICILVSVLVLIKSNKESDKKIKEEIQRCNESWAKAVDSLTYYRDKMFELYEQQLDEKSKRIVDLENQVAKNEAIMSLVNVIEPLRGKIDGTAEKSEKN